MISAALAEAISKAAAAAGEKAKWDVLAPAVDEHAAIWRDIFALLVESIEAINPELSTAVDEAAPANESGTRVVPDGLVSLREAGKALVAYFGKVDSAIAWVHAQRKERGIDRRLIANIRRSQEMGLDAACKRLDVSFTLRDLGAERFAAERAAWLVKNVDETTRERIRGIVTRGLETGASTERMSRDVIKYCKGDFAEARPQIHIRNRAHLIAVTETAYAYENAHLQLGQAMSRAGLPMVKEWGVSFDERTCPICTGNGGDALIPLDREFSSGHDSPPAHPACRCFMNVLLDPNAVGPVTPPKPPITPPKPKPPVRPKPKPPAKPKPKPEPPAPEPPEIVTPPVSPPATPPAGDQYAWRPAMNQEDASKWTAGTYGEAKGAGARSFYHGTTAGRAADIRAVGFDLTPRPGGLFRRIDGIELSLDPDTADVFAKNTARLARTAREKATRSEVVRVAVRVQDERVLRMTGAEWDRFLAEVDDATRASGIAGGAINQAQKNLLFQRQRAAAVKARGYDAVEVTPEGEPFGGGKALKEWAERTGGKRLIVLDPQAITVIDETLAPGLTRVGGRVLRQPKGPVRKLAEDTKLTELPGTTYDAGSVGARVLETVDGNDRLRTLWLEAAESRSDLSIADMADDVLDEMGEKATAASRVVAFKALQSRARSYQLYIDRQDLPVLKKIVGKKADDFEPFSDEALACIRRDVLSAGDMDVMNAAGWREAEKLMQAEMDAMLKRLEKQYPSLGLDDLRYGEGGGAYQGGLMRSTPVSVMQELAAPGPISATAYPAVKTAANRALKWYGQMLSEGVNRTLNPVYKVTVKRSARSWYRASNHEMLWNGNDGVFVHELGHHLMDRSSGRGVAESLTHAFFDRRRAGEKLTRIYPGSNEVGYRDKWFDHYVGKQYGTGGWQGHEIPSMGVQQLYNGRPRAWQRFADEDREHFLYTLALLMGVI